MRPASAARAPRRVRAPVVCLAAAAVAALLTGGCAWIGPSASSLEAARERMVVEAVVGAGVRDPRVIEAMRTTPRHEFVPRHLRRHAYDDRALPIEDRQTISSPSIVAAMTEALEPAATDRVLEIGSGSGYQAAVLSPLVADVYSVEIVPPLGERAAARLERLGYENVHIRIGDGFLGWPDQAPFDKIIVTCSPEAVPEPLVEQLREGGLLLIPLGERTQQTLYRMRKRQGELRVESLRPTLFVPMLGRAGSVRHERMDPLSLEVVNGGFEDETSEAGFVPGWYDQRSAARARSADAPEGAHVLRLESRSPGGPAQVLQALPIDGRALAAVDLALWVRLDQVEPGDGEHENALAALSLYDERHQAVAHALLGPFEGSQGWRRLATRLEVPPRARLGVLRLGLFGATGVIAFDDVRVSPTARD